MASCLDGLACLRYSSNGIDGGYARAVIPIIYGSIIQYGASSRDIHYTIMAVISNALIHRDANMTGLLGGCVLTENQEMSGDVERFDAYVATLEHHHIANQCRPITIHHRFQ